MTRINLIPVEELSDSHLLAEHREIKRIPNCILKGKFNLKNIPEHYTMGKGHVSFFYDKLKWLNERSDKLFWECHRRGFKVTDYSDSFARCYSYLKLNNKEFLWNSWKPTEEDIRVSRTRIAEKIFRKEVCQQQGFYRWSR